MRRIASDPGATERLRETRRATVSRTRSDLAVRYVRTNTRLFWGNTEYFISVGLPKGGYFLYARRSKYPQEKPATPQARSRRQSAPPTTLRLSSVLLRFARLHFAKLRGLRTLRMTRKVFAQWCAFVCGRPMVAPTIFVCTLGGCAAVCVCLRTTDGRPYDFCVYVCRL